jgi:organic hydroperoxide reductase OsmC/OhrA
VVMSTRPKRTEYHVALDGEGRLTAEGEASFKPADPWTPEHLLLAALARCSVNALQYHARRADLAVEASATASGAVTRREGDGRYAFVEVECRVEADLDPLPADEDLRTLLTKAERGCFIGASVTAGPRYSWIVNGKEVE